jgi:hypothetical protein
MTAKVDNDLLKLICCLFVEGFIQELTSVMETNSPAHSTNTHYIILNGVVCSLTVQRKD